MTAPRVEIGADEYVTKPFSPREIVAASAPPTPPPVRGGARGRSRRRADFACRTWYSTSRA